MNNVILFRERSFATQFSASNLSSAKSGVPSVERTVPMSRPRLIAVWHTNPSTGKQECFWTTESDPVLDEDGSSRAA